MVIGIFKGIFKGTFKVFRDNVQGTKVVQVNVVNNENGTLLSVESVSNTSLLQTYRTPIDVASDTFLSPALSYCCGLCNHQHSPPCSLF